jgi:outer membrane protein TolC
MTSRSMAALLLLIVAAATPAHGGAQTVRLSLEDALRRAEDASEALTISRAGEARADADIERARSARLPQLGFSGSYDRTLASEFSSFESTGPACNPFSADSTRPLTDRVAEIERAASCGALGTSFDFADLPFGQRNIYRLNLSFSQPLYAGGRLTALAEQAGLGRQSATLATDTTRATLHLEVTRAFFDVALAARLLAIAESGYQQADAAFSQARFAFDAGRQPEFEVLRAQVTRDNQQPVVIRRRADRDLALLRLRQLLGLPPGTVLDLDVDLDAAELAPPAPFVAALAAAGTTADHVDVRQAETNVSLREAAVRIAHAQRLPTVSLNSAFGEVGYPNSGALPGLDDFRTNWTVGAAVQIPIFTGFRIRADERAAVADLAAATARLQQARELVELDTETARQDLAAADAVWRASAGAIQQARRAYEIAELRYREGLSTQLELSDSRLSLQVAQANRAQAARDLQLARSRVALLPNLPAGGR